MYLIPNRLHPSGGRRTGLLLVAVVAVLQLALAGAAHAQAQHELPPEGEGPAVRHPEAVEAISQLKSPYCPGMMLEVCSSTQGAALRDSLDALAQAGMDSDELVEWMLANHGEQYRALPKRSGTGLVAWVVPPLAAVAGLGLVIFVLAGMRARRRRAGEAPVPGGQRDLTGAEEQRLREAVRRFDQEEEAPLF